MSFDLIYLFITTLLKSNSLHNEESCQIALVVFTNKKNRGYFLENNCFYKVICKYILAIINQEIEVLVAYKVL